MSEITSTTAEPAYVTRLALTRLPFAVTPDKTSFFEEQQIQQRRLLLLHLLRSTRSAVYLCAATGMGKSTMLLQLQKEEASDLRFCVINIHSFDTALSNMARAFGAGQDSLSAEQLIQQRLVQLRRLNIVPVLLIDDVDQLSAEAMAQLSQWLSWQHEEQSLLQAVLTGRAASVDIPRLQQLDLPVLAPMQIPAYLLHRLRSVGYQSDLPFNNKQLKKIIRQSQGVPGKVNQLAHQQLLGVNVAVNWREWLPANLGKTLRWLVITGLAVIVLAVLIYQNDINRWINPMDDTEKVIAIPPVNESDPIAPVIIGENKVAKVNTPALAPKPTYDELVKRDELAGLLAEISPQPPSKSVSNDLTAAKDADETNEQAQSIKSGSAKPNSELSATAELPSPLPETELAKSTSGSTSTEVSLSDPLPVSAQPVTPEQSSISEQSSTTTEPDNSLQAPPTSVSAQSSVGKTVIHDKDWLLSQKPTQYTFQLMGAWGQAEMDTFIKKYQLSGDVALFTSLRNGKPWHVLVYGLYSSRQAALSASNQWQPPLKNVSTWLRRMDSVQNQIKNKGVTP